MERDSAKAARKVFMAVAGVGMNSRCGLLLQLDCELVARAVERDNKAAWIKYKLLAHAIVLH
jgi:hypothetical protein